MSDVRSRGTGPLNFRTEPTGRKEAKPTTPNPFEPMDDGRWRSATIFMAFVAALEFGPARRSGISLLGNPSKNHLKAETASAASGAHKTQHTRPALDRCPDDELRSPGRGCRARTEERDKEMGAPPRRFAPSRGHERRSPLASTRARSTRSEREGERTTLRAGEGTV